MILRISDEVINVYSELNPWIDFIVFLADKRDCDRAEEIISKAYDDWFEMENADTVGDVTIVEYIYNELKTSGINFELYVREDTESE